MTLNQEIDQWLHNNKKNFHAISRPFVTLSYAQSLDGSIAVNPGKALALSGTEATCLTHQLRSLHDGILVGISTVLTDDPQLSVRQWDGPNPQPIVLDSQLRMPTTARLWQTNGKRCWVLTTVAQTSASDGPEILSVQSNHEGRVCLNAALQLLYQKGIRSLMVEGGANVITAFLKMRLADALVLTIVPRLVGGYKAVSDLGITQVQNFPALAPLSTGKCGNDLIVWGNLQYGEQIS